MAPSIEKLSQYSAVFVGRVTGIHLKGYENGLLSRPDGVDPEIGAFSITNGASPVTVYAAVTQNIRGALSGSVELRLAGCTFDPPQLRERAVFFVQPEGTIALVVKEGDGSEFLAWLTRLGVPELAR
jgi:hypothetical protein